MKGTGASVVTDQSNNKQNGPFQSAPQICKYTTESTEDSLQLPALPPLKRSSHLYGRELVEDTWRWANSRWTRAVDSASKWRRQQKKHKHVANGNIQDGPPFPLLSGTEERARNQEEPVNAAGTQWVFSDGSLPWTVWKSLLGDE